jgi:hypothetical protein
LNNDLTFEEVLKRIDVYGRLAYGGQCVAAMAMVAAVLLFITTSIVPFVIWDDDRGEALAFWLGGWAVSVGALAGAVAFAAFCWRWSGDWITDWPGYAVGFAVAIVANIVLAWLLTSTPVPVPASFALTMAAAFAVGFVIAGNLAGVRMLDEQRDARLRAPVRRR